MKRPRTETGSGTSESPRKAVPGPRASASRRWGFRVFALFSPLLLLAMVEVALRLAGCGYPTSFFLQAERDGRRILVENPRFGWRFFPRKVSRSPQPLAITEPKTPGTIRLFVLGESAAMGDPDPAYGLPRQLERMLRARHADKNIEVINVAMTAINSHVIREIARDCARLNGDLWVIYTGNNEVIGPFGAGTVFGRQAPGLGLVRFSLALKRTRVGQFLASLSLKTTEPVSWEGMEMFLRQQVAHNDQRLARVYENYEANLGEIVALGRHAGTKILFATMAVNLKDCPPFASAHKAGLIERSKQAWEKSFARGVEAEKTNDFSLASQTYSEAGQIDADFAALAFRQARCHQAQGNLAAAKTEYERARDLDVLRFRADQSMNEIVRHTAEKLSVRLVDAERECALRAQDGIPGEDLFYDHVHLNFAGNYWLAKLLLPAVEQELFGAVTSTNPLVLPEMEMARQLGFTGFDEHRVAEEMRLRLQQPPFSSQLNFKQRDEHWTKVLTALEGSPRRAISDYGFALGLARHDWVLHANFGRVLEAAGDSSAALAEWTKVSELMPHLPDGWFQRGNLSYASGRYVEAEDLFRQALARKPDSVDSLISLGLALAAQDKNELAVQRFKEALQLDPRSSAARVNLAVILAKRGELAAAEAQYRLVLADDTNSVAARINLAKLVTHQGKTEEALRLYTEAVQLKPDDPIAQFNLGNTLVALARHAEAASHFAAAVKAQPEFADARYNLALELARLGRIPEASAEFAELVRLKPDMAEARFNYGVALAKQQRFSEAAVQFQETLRLQPNHPQARSALDKLSQRTGGTAK